MKTSFRTVLPLLLLVLVIAACSSEGNTNHAQEDNQVNEGAQQQNKVEPEKKEEPAEPVTLEFASNASGATLDAYKLLVDKFNSEHPLIQIELNPISKDYETLMNARMATNDLPDLFNTHGWSVAKYSEFLRPLNDQPWASGLVDEIKPIITNADGDFFVLPFDVDVSGLLYNPEILEELSIAVPETWEEFFVAAEAVKQAGYTPIHVGGKDSSSLAGMINRIALSLLIMDSSTDHGPKLQDGSFDWTQFDQVTNFMLDMRDKGYYNVDDVTADKNATHTEMAAGKAVFTFQSNQSITEIQKLNPESKVNMMRLPVQSASDEPFLVSGERDAIGVWKDTAHEEQALAFLEFMAQPEHVAAVAASYSIPAAFKGVEVNLGALNDVFMQYEGAAITNHFDRKYLPNGMWNTLKSVGTGMLSGMSASEVSDMMKQDYDRLRASAAQ